MATTPRLADLLRQHMRRPETFCSLGIVSKRSGVPKATIANWLEGRVERPRHYLDLVKVAAALHLGAPETNELLLASRYPPIAVLYIQTGSVAERELLARWMPSPTAARPASTPRTLTLMLSPLIGRSVEVAAIIALLRQPDIHLITLTGPGGVGKTHLALKIAEDLRPDFAGGVGFVSLAPLNKPELVLSAIVRALGLVEALGPNGHAIADLARLAEALYDQQMLLLLDNFEQVAASGPLISELLAACPRLKVLVTSREALRLQGEQEFTVEPLALPAAPLVEMEQVCTEVGDSRLWEVLHAPVSMARVTELETYAAVDLFVRRARASQPEFGLTKANARAVEAICRCLDGLPLAIELAAAQVKLLPPHALLARLNAANHVVSLQLLNDGRRDGPIRQRTLRDTIAWSYNLLTPAEQRLFRWLAVFVGGFSLDAAEAIAGAGDFTLQGLGSLVNKSLLRQIEQSDGEPRLFMLETIRAFGLEQLAQHDESAAARYRHARFFLECVEASEPGLRCPQQDQWLDRLAPELENVRAALQWSETAVAMGGSDATEAALLGLRLAAVVWRFCIGRGYMKEARTWLEGAFTRLRRQIVVGNPGLVAHPDLERVRRAWAKGLIGIGMVARIQGDLEHAEACLYEGLYLSHTLGDRLIIADALLALGNVTWLRGEVVRTEKLFDQCLAIYRELGDDSGIIWALNGLGNVSQAQEDYERAIRLHKEGLRHASLVGFKRLIAWSLSNLGSAVLAQGEAQRAELLLLESLALLRMLRDRQGIAHVLCCLGSLTMQRGDTRCAVAYFEESMALHRELGDRQGVLTCLRGLAGVDAADSKPAP